MGSAKPIHSTSSTIRFVVLYRSRMLMNCNVLCEVHVGLQEIANEAL
jgi:hypothetical protein